LAFSGALVAIALWCWLGRRTQGFPFLFDSLALQVLLWSAVVALWVVARWLRESTPQE
jgi:hypothetical protein